MSVIATTMSTTLLAVLVLVLLLISKVTTIALIPSQVKWSLAVSKLHSRLFMLEYVKGEFLDADAGVKLLYYTLATSGNRVY